MLNTVSLFCSASGLERDSSEPDGPCLTGKLSDVDLASKSLFHSELLQPHLNFKSRSESR